MTGRTKVCAACGTPACLAGDWICGDPERGTVWCTCDWGDWTYELYPVTIADDCGMHGGAVHAHVQR